MPRNKDNEKNPLKKARLKKLSLFPTRKKLQHPSDREQAKKWMHDVAKHLDTWPNAGPAYLFVAYALRRYLSGRTHTLEAAFELNKKRGVPGWPKERLRMAKTVHRLKKASKSKSQIQKALQKLGFRNTDWGTIKRTHTEFLTELKAEDIWQSIAPELLQDDK